MTICFYSKYSLGGGGIHLTLYATYQTQASMFSERRAAKYFFFFLVLKGLGWFGHPVMSDHSYEHFLQVLALTRIQGKTCTVWSSLMNISAKSELFNFSAIPKNISQVTKLGCRS